tara:strand:+ start:360 stop:1187 length:828 start_codon:yes stop_codon:yes gene_type:complete
MNNEFIIIGGPCVIESRDLVLDIASKMKNISEKYGFRYIFKASFDKANRSSVDSYRGKGIDEGLKILEEVKKEFELEILTDIHESKQAKPVSEIVDVIQIPAFLCRQTDLLKAAVKAVNGTNKIINVKKGQFLAPWDMSQVVNKVKEFGLNIQSKKLWLTERGSSFGYNTLVVDCRSFPILKSLGCPVIFDATHSVQQPGGRGTSSGGQREFVATLARAAVSADVDGLFMEVHPDPDKGLSDGPNMVPIHRVEPLIKQLLEIRKIVNGKLTISDY